jgi:hypothetical protein
MQNSLKGGEDLPQLLCMFALVCAIRKVQEHQEGIGITWIMDENINTVQKNTEALLEVSRYIGLNVST